MEDFLKSQGVTELKSYDSTGLSSKVHTGVKYGKKVIIHHTYPKDEQIYTNTKESIIFVSSLLAEKGFPCTPIIASKTLEDGSFVLIQEMLPGSTLGYRDFSGKYVRDFYDEKYVNKVMSMINDLHKIKLSGFGFLKNGKGSHTSWREFLNEESARWINNIYSEKPNVMSEEDKNHIESVVVKLLNHRSTDWSESCFLTGDIANPSNILVKDGDITGIVDFEWALSGDPAWEFAFCNMPMDKYIELSGFDKDTFKERIKACRFFFFLWAVNVHAKGELKALLYKHLKEEIDYWLKKLE